MRLRTESEITSSWIYNTSITPKLSIACITYNHQAFIEEAIVGFLMQETNFPIEIIVHDDASTDSTADIVRKYQHAYPNIIKPIYQTENQYSQGKNPFITVCNLCQGQYIAVCEGDDYWTDPLKLQKQVDFLERNPDFVVCFHNSIVKHDDGSPEHIAKTKIWDIADLQRILSFTDFTRDFLVCPAHTSSMVYRTNIFDFPYWFNRVVGGDQVTMILLSQHGKSKFINEVMSTYRIHSGGVSSASDHSGINLYSHRLYNYENFYYLLPESVKNQLREIIKYYYCEIDRETTKNYLSITNICKNDLNTYLAPRFLDVRAQILKFTSSMKYHSVYPFKYFYSETSGKSEIYSSTYALMILSLTGEINKLSVSDKKAWADYFDSMQSGVDGLFYDPVLKNELFDNTDWWGARHLAVQIVSCYRILGYRPSNKFKFLTELYDEHNLQKLLESLDLDNQATSDVDNYLMNIGVLLQFNRDFFNDVQAGETLFKLQNWMVDNLNPETGLWGKLVPQTPQEISRSIQFYYHLYLLFEYDKIKLPYREKVIDWALKTQNANGGFGVDADKSSACEDIDSVDILIRYGRVLNYRREDVVHALLKAIPWILSNFNNGGGAVFKRDDIFKYGHDLMTTTYNQSSLFATWFRLLSLAYISDFLGTDMDIPELKKMFCIDDAPGYIFRSRYLVPVDQTLSEIIRRRNPDDLVNELISSGIPCRNLQINIEDFVNFLKVFPKLSLHYSQYGDVHIEKCLEHYLAYKILNLSSSMTYIDIAASGSKWSDYLLEHSIDAYSLDLSYPSGTHGRKIGANAAATGLPDDSVDTMSLQCAFETFRGDNDILFVKEAGRILKEDGAVLVSPLYLDPVHFIMSSKDTDLSTAPLDEGAIRVWREDEYKEAFSRHYSPQALLERIFKNLGDLTAEVIYIPNLEELRQVFPGQRIYCDFLLLVKKPCLTKKSTIFDAILSPVSNHRLSIDPDSIFTHLTQDEKHTLKNLAANINGKIFVELGSYLGASSYYIASGLTNKTDVKLHCVDTWQNDAMSEGKRDTYDEFLCNIKPFSNFIVPIRDTTTNVALNFRQNIDFLFIDAGHDYEDVYNDVTHWFPKLNHGATVVFHDIGWAEGVKRVVNENIKPIAFNVGSLPNMYWAQIYTLNLSVIIPTRNRAALLYNTLDSLTRQTYPQHLFEIIVVDNGSTDDTPDVCQYFKRRLPNLTYISDPRPGLHNGRHTGHQAAKGDILVYGDDDIEALPTWLEGIAESFADESVGIVGGKNLPKFEVTPPAWVDDLKIAYKNGWWLGCYSILDFGDEVQEIRHELVWGCNFSIRKTLLKQAGGFHPDSVPQELIKYRGDGETAVSAAVRNLDYRAVYNPKASVYHVVSATRLTPDYIYTRMFNQGVSDSYTSIRKTGGFTPARLYGPASGNIHEVVNRGLVDGFNWHQQMVQADPALLEWVLRDNYMGEKGTP